MAPLILVIDDDPDILEMYCQALAAEGYTVACYADPLPAVDSAPLSQPALVILDWLFADADTGLTTLRSLRTNPATAHIPILVATAAVHHLQRYAGDLAAAGIPILYKPFYLDELLSLVSMLVSRGIAAPRRW
jgi:DNA-binding response OmpR family regulator